MFDPLNNFTVHVLCLDLSLLSFAGALFLWVTVLYHDRMTSSEILSAFTNSRPAKHLQKLGSLFVFVEIAGLLSRTEGCRRRAGSEPQISSVKNRFAIFGADLKMPSYAGGIVKVTLDEIMD
jgi:hypothetical protein